MPPLLLLVATLTATASPAPGQTRPSVEGMVVDSVGAPIAGAVLTLTSAAPPPATFSTVTASDGTFLLENVPTGQYALEVRIIGYGRLERTLLVGAGGVADLRLVLIGDPVDVPALAVEAERGRLGPGEGVAATVRSLEAEELDLIPGLAGADVLRAVEVLPGVVSTSDFSSAFNVRGGSADQNLILLDGIPIYNPFHLGGLFSVFNGDMVARAELVTGAMPARYGGRVSSVLTVETDPGGTGTQMEGGISLLAARAAVGLEVPEPAVRTLGLRKARVRGSVRRSWFDAVLSPVYEFPYHLTDVQLHAEGWTPGGGRITLTGYSGKDVLDFRETDPDDFPLRLRWDWGNDVLGGRWLHPLSSGGRLALSGGYSRFATAVDFPDFDATRFSSRIAEGFVEVGVRSARTRAVTLESGVAARRLGYHNVAAAGGTVFREREERAWGLAGWLQGDWRPGPWAVEAGARFEGWLPAAGPERWAISPRLALERRLPGGLALRAAAGRYAQYLHSLRDEELPLGIDVWVITGRRAPHVVSDQIQLGIDVPVGADWSVSLEGYGRTFDGVVTNNFAEDPNAPEDDLLVGEGRSYGWDALVRHRGSGRVTGWLAVSWLRATRSFPDPTYSGESRPVLRYPPVFDRRLDADLVLSARLPKGLTGGLRWNWGSGLPYTRPLSSYGYYEYELISGGRVRPRLTGGDDGADLDQAVYLGPRNAERYPAYHRLDLSLRRRFTTSWGRITPYLEVLNAYNRKNVLFYFFDYDDVPATRSGVSMFPVLPTFGAEVRW